MVHTAQAPITHVSEWGRAVERPRVLWWTHGLLSVQNTNTHLSLKLLCQQMSTFHSWEPLDFMSLPSTFLPDKPHLIWHSAGKGDHRTSPCSSRDDDGTSGLLSKYRCLKISFFRNTHLRVDVNVWLFHQHQLKKIYVEAMVCHQFDLITLTVGWMERVIDKHQHGMTCYSW